MEGGSASDYDYACGDPVNGANLDGTCATRRTAGWSWRRVRNARCRAARAAGAALAGTAAAVRLAARCAADFVTCGDNVKVALGPVFVGGVFLATGILLVSACSTLVGCLVAAPVLPIVGAGGGWATYRTARELWWGPRRDRYYHEFGGADR